MIELASLVGRTLDSKYQLEEQLGQGGMGTVFRATHLGTDRVVALKLIAPGLMDQEDFVQRFQREARATGRLRHPNIVDLTDFGFAVVEGKKLAYLVMEFLEGESLSDLLKKVAAYIPGETWEWRIRRTRYAGQRSRVAAGPGNLLAGFSGLAVGTSVCVGLKIWDRFLPQELHYGIWAFAAWGILWCTLLLSLLAPLSAIFSALAYLRLRKIARESMAEAYKNFEARFSGKAPKEGV